MHILSQLLSGELRGTKRLDLRGGLTEFPLEILDLADSLEILDLSGNRLSSLPPEFARLQKLRILFCSDNEFDHLPPVLGECPALEMIGFKANRIVTVEEPALPAHLRWLILTDNRLEKLPDSIGRCPRLQKLMLAGNRLETLPDPMAACVNLELIRLSANRFESFPGWLFELPRLAWLGLGGNPWSSAPDGIRMREITWAEMAVEHTLGEGASGVIHRALWRERPVAVKVFKGGMTSDGLPAEEMAVSLAAGNHPNLIGVLGELRDHPEGRQGLVMPLVDPGFTNLAGPPDLDSCTRDIYAGDFTLDLPRLLGMASGLAAVAGHLHRLGMTHGDFYAHNVLTNATGECLLGDFGAASFYPPEVGLERIEVRAFGCLLEELLARLDFPEGDGEIVANLQALQGRCVQEKVAKRPDFTEILEHLRDLTAGVISCSSISRSRAPASRIQPDERRPPP